MTEPESMDALTTRFGDIAGAALVAALDSDAATTSFGLAPGLVLAYTSPAWTAFARANGGDDVLRDYPVGRSIEPAIPAILRPFYLDSIGRLEPGGVWEHVYECSSPTRYRQFRMRCHALREPGYVVVTNHVVIEVAAAPGLEGLDASYRRDDGWLTQCSHCRRFRHGSSTRWDWIPAFIAAPLPSVTHGLCPPCFEYHYPA